MVGLIVTDRVKSPILFGFIRPRVLLPADLARELPIERLRYILLHELAHLKRCDIHTGWILAFLQSLHWFNPLVWWAFGRMRFDRELACDEQVLLRVPDAERRDYGDVLIGMLERFNHVHNLPAIAGILENKDQLKRRLVMIKKFRRPMRREIIMFAALLAALSIALLTEPQSLISQQQSLISQSNEQTQDIPNVIPVIVSISDTGQIDINGFGLTLDQLEAELQRIYSERLNKEIFIRTSQNFSYEDIVFVVDIARKAGAGNVGLITKDSDSQRTSLKILPDNTLSYEIVCLHDGLRYSLGAIVKTENDSRRRCRPDGEWTEAEDWELGLAPKPVAQKEPEVLRVAAENREQMEADD
jgi:biopolymer transport protein ExbD